MNLITLHKTYRAQPKKQAKIYIGGVDAAKYADAQGFSDYFRANYDPTNPVVVPVGNIKSYITEPDRNGRLNIAVEIQGEFQVPSGVFSNRASSESGSRITYIIDEQKIITGLNGNRNFAGNPLQFILLNQLQSVAQQWINGPPRVLDLESLIDLNSLHFTNFRNGNDRINIRNATNFLDDPANDNVFYNYNLNGKANAKKVIYVHSSMATINNGSPFASLQTAINRGADVRYVSDTTTIPPNITDLSIAEIGATYIKFAFTNISSADFYEVFRSNYQNVIEQFFPLQEVTNGFKYLTGLEPNTTYNLQLFTRDVNYNQSDGSNIVGAQTIANDLTIAELSKGGTYVEFSISNPTPYTINQVEVYVDGVLNYTVNGNLTNAYAINLSQQTSYDIDIVAKTDKEINSTSNTITATTTIDKSLIFPTPEIKFYHRADETSGSPINLVNNYPISMVGTIQRDGQWYDYGTGGAYLETPDTDDYSFVDSSGNNTDFVIKTEVIFDGFNSRDLAFLVSKREKGSDTTYAEWQLNYSSGQISFLAFDSNFNIGRVDFNLNPNTGQKYILGVTLNGNTLDLFIDGDIVATSTLPSGFIFNNGISPVKLGSETFGNDLNLIGRQKETTIIKGLGWTAGQISDNYANGNGITY